ncbi:hypothetical protein MD537_09970 [Flavihumibacter sediminis]|nr:hypothetical protein [Flavihumibacter sediminis]
MTAFKSIFRKQQTWISFVLVLAITLRAIQYFARSSMWLDELAAAFNVMERNFYQLATESLGFNQVAPPGFLYLQKIATLIIGENDHAFRFFPFLFSLAGLLFYRSLCKTYTTGVPGIGAFALFALSIAMVFYSGESKQYAGDLTAAVFIVWTAHQLIYKVPDKRRLWVMAIGGPILILCSMPAVVMAPMAMLIVFIRILQKKSPIALSRFFAVVIPWAFACLLVTLYATLVISTDVQEAMSEYWSRGFAPLHSVWELLKWFPTKIHKELSFSLAWWAADIIPFTSYIAWALMILSVPGLIYCSKKYGIATLLLFIPLITALLLSILRVLPFDNRVSLYATWPIFISGMAGINALGEWRPQIFRPVVVAILATLIAFPLAITKLAVPLLRPPYNGQSAQPILRELKKQWQPGDVLYVYFKSRYALRFYGPREGITEYIAGRSHPSVEPILRDIDSLRGKKRVWFFFSQSTPKQPFPDSIKAYMGTVIGKQIAVIPDPDGNTGEAEAAAHLYDLSIKEENQ